MTATVYRIALVIAVAAVCLTLGSKAAAIAIAHTVDSATPSTGVVDQCARRTAFSACLKDAPATPNGATFPGWPAVIGECRAFALEVSFRAPDHVDPACRAE